MRYREANDKLAYRKMFNVLWCAGVIIQGLEGGRWKVEVGNESCTVPYSYEFTSKCCSRSIN
jgi:hypothetical protein